MKNIKRGCEKLTSRRNRSMWSLFTLLVSSFWVISCCPRMYTSTCFETALRAAEWAHEAGSYDSALMRSPHCQSSAQDCQSKVRLFPGGSAFPAENWTSVLNYSMAVHQENKSVLSGRRVPANLLMWSRRLNLQRGNCPAFDLKSYLSWGSWACPVWSVIFKPLQHRFSHSGCH